MKPGSKPSFGVNFGKSPESGAGWGGQQYSGASAATPSTATLSTPANGGIDPSSPEIASLLKAVNSGRSLYENKWSGGEPGSGNTSNTSYGEHPEWNMLTNPPENPTLIGAPYAAEGGLVPGGDKAASPGVPTINTPSINSQGTPGFGLNNNYGMDPSNIINTLMSQSAAGAWV